MGTVTMQQMISKILKKEIYDWVLNVYKVPTINTTF